MNKQRVDELLREVNDAICKVIAELTDAIDNLGERPIGLDLDGENGVSFTMLNDDQQTDVFNFDKIAVQSGILAVHDTYSDEWFDVPTLSNDVLLELPYYIIWD